MRSIMVMALMLAALLAGGWIGGETLLARSAARMIAADPRIEAAAVREMRDVDRIGVRIEGARFSDPARMLDATGDWLDLWVTPTAPNELHAAVAPATRVEAASRTFGFGQEGAEASLRFSPTRGMALGEARMTATKITLDDKPAIDGITMHANLTGYGADAPAGTGAAYDVNGVLDGLDLGPFSAGRVPGKAGINGAGRVWLSAVPVSAADVAGGEINAARPQLIGLRADGVDLALDDLEARVYGRLVADAEGFASGEVLIDTADARGFIDRAVALGVMPGKLAPLVMTTITAVSTQQAPGEPGPATGVTSGGTPPGGAATSAASASAPARPATTRSVTDMADHIAPPAAAWPTPRKGELRIPLLFRGGRLSLGPIPLGAAPRLSPQGGA